MTWLLELGLGFKAADILYADWCYLHGYIEYLVSRSSAPVESDEKRPAAGERLKHLQNQTAEVQEVPFA